MSIFGNIFGKNPSAKTINDYWTPIVSQEDLEETINLSYDRKVVIFKHSTTCGVSRMALKKFENEMGLLKDDVGFFYLDLLAHRDLSDKIAREFGVAHQSPQIIVLENGKAVGEASHENISITVI